jgi:hypothetical protein
VFTSRRSRATFLSTINGCEYFPESTFKLANESRLPKWFALTPSLVRANVSVEMSYYAKPWGSSATFVLQDARNGILRKASGKLACTEPFHVKNAPQRFATGYPAYEPMTVNGVTEMIEHRRTETVFYITDDPVAWKPVCDERLRIVEIAVPRTEARKELPKSRVSCMSRRRVR